MQHPTTWAAGLWLAAVASISFGAAPDAAPSTAAAAPQGQRARGLTVTYEPGDPERRRKEGVHTYRADFLSLAVERGETPTPLLSPGLFRATFRGQLGLPMRERYRFRIAGRGAVQLSINGEKVLSGNLRQGQQLETDKSVRLQKGDNAVELQIESSVFGEAELRVLWSGFDFGFEPIAPELWQYDAADAAVQAGEQLRRGHQLFVERRCVRCHRPVQVTDAGAYSELDQPGPDLRDVGARLHQGWIAEWLRDPRAIIADARMPRFRLAQDSGYDDLAAWLATLGQPLEATPFAADAADRGAVRFRELGCVACHIAPGEKVDDQTGFNRLDLAFVGRKWRPLALEQYLREPRRGRSHARMPDFRLEGDDPTVLAAFLLRDATPPTAERGDAERGRKLAQQNGCDRCHDMPVPETGRRFRDLEALHVDHGCLDDSEDAPDFGLDAIDLAALRAFLPRAEAATHRRAPLDYAVRMVDTLRCKNCHAFAGEASVWAELTQIWSEQAPLPPEQDPLAQGVPALTWVGAKLQPSWMERFVTGRGTSPRPWLHARMPAFPAHGAVIVQGLVRAHGYTGRDEPETAPDVQLANAGQKLVKMGEGFGCVQCHGVGDQPPVQVFERQGINFDVAAARLRKEYYMRWLLDPPRIDPDSRMPKYADDKGRTAFTDVLGGDASKQFEAIWHWFRTLR